MNTTKTIAALFDFDGVIMDTETQYTVFWDEQGRKYLNEEDFGEILFSSSGSPAENHGRPQCF